MEKIEQPSLEEPEFLAGPVFRGDKRQQRSRSPLGIAHRPISVRNFLDGLNFIDLSSLFGFKIGFFK
ncbi:hypothetical protein AG4045_005099 [Apium graveolens]|uniref:Uncharacterized protein n=1 Tax=Apium graveolens TaxID=4045 RepID=A0A6L5B7S6_APIGR|nr:hypothetical protein AG4045_005099 [Apium graveolens]